MTLTSLVSKEKEIGMFNLSLSLIRLYEKKIILSPTYLFYTLNTQKYLELILVQQHYESTVPSHAVLPKCHCSRLAFFVDCF